MKKLTLTIAAALISGAAYGQQLDPAADSRRMMEETVRQSEQLIIQQRNDYAASQRQQELLDEIQLMRRQQRSQLEQLEMQRRNCETYRPVFTWPTDCE